MAAGYIRRLRAPTELNRMKLREAEGDSQAGGEKTKIIDGWLRAVCGMLGLGSLHNWSLAGYQPPPPPLGFSFCPSVAQNNMSRSLALGHCCQTVASSSPL